MSARPCIVVPRIAAYGDGRPYSAHIDHEHRVRVDLFLPYDLANPGNVVVWDGGHSEGHLSYYWRTRPARTPAERAAADKAVERYRAWMASIPEDARELIERRERFPVDWRAVAWRPVEAAT